MNTRTEPALDDWQGARIASGAAAGMAASCSPQLLATARALFHEGLSRSSKAARCYLLVEDGNIDLPLAPRNAEPIDVNPDQSIGEAAIVALCECLDQIATNV